MSSSQKTLFPSLDSKRVDRAINERLALLSRHHEVVPGLVTKFEYTIKGSRDIDYTVTYDALDGLSHQILFVLYCVCGLDRRRPLLLLPGQ